MVKPTTTPRSMETTADVKHSEEMDEEKLQQAADQMDKMRDEAEEAKGDREQKQFPEIIGQGISACMRDRTAHMRIEKEMDQWVNGLSPNKNTRGIQLKEAREQIETAKLALEAFYLRFRNLASTAKN